MNYVLIRQLAFELYRYTVCFSAIVMFGLFAYQFLGLLITKQGNETQVALMGAGIIVPALLFLIHWFMEAPTEESIKPPKKPEASTKE